MLFALLLAMGSAAAGDASGVNEVWTGAGGDTNWNTNANWSDLSYPDAGDNISFPDVTNQTVSINVAATVGTITFNAADVYTVGGASTLTLGGTVTQSGAGTVAISAPVATGNAARIFTGAGSGQVTLSGIVSGSGVITVAAGSYRFTNAANTFSSAASASGGTLTAEATTGYLGINTGIASQVGTANGITIDSGGTVSLLAPVDTIYLSDNSAATSRTFTFGTGGGLLNIGSQVGLGAFTDGCLSVDVNALSGTPAVIRYGTISTASDGWNWAGANLFLYNSYVSGSGSLRLELTGGSSSWRKKTFAGTLAVTGVTGGAYPTASTADAATTVGRLIWDAESVGGAFTATGGFTFAGTLQMIGDDSVPTIDSDIAISSGTVGFQGFSSSGSPMVLGSTIGGKTMTIANGATAILDARLTGSNYSTVSGTTLNEHAVLNAGGTLSCRQSVSGGTVGTITITGNVTGQGTAAAESIFDLRLTNGSGAGNLNLGTPGASGNDLIVDGTTTGGLKVQGTNAILSGHLSAARLAAVTGTGGSLTIAPADATFTMPASSMWSDIDISLRVVDSYASGTDLALSDAAATCARPITIDSSAMLGVGHATTATTITGGITGAGGLTKTGAAVTTLSTTDCTFTGPLTVSAGLLSANATCSGGGAVSVASSATLGGSGSLAGVVSLANTATLAPGASAGAVGTVTLSAASPLTCAATVSLAMDINGVSGDQVFCSAGSGSLSLSNLALNLTCTSPSVASYTLISYPSGTITGVFASKSGVPAGYTVVYTSTSVVLTSSIKVWTGGGSNSNWNTALNWSDSVLPVSGDNVFFPDVTSQTVSMNVAATVGTITFNAADAYTVNGASTLTLGGTVTQSGAGTVTISAPVATGNAARTLTGAGTGQVTLSGIVSGSGVITIAGGNYRFTNSANSFSTAASVSGGSLTAAATSGDLIVYTGGAGHLGTTTGITIDAGSTLTLSAPSGEVNLSNGGPASSRLFTFGTGGGTLDIASQADLVGHLYSIVGLAVNAAAGTPAVIRYNTIGTVSDGWDSSGRVLFFWDAVVSGNGSLRLEMTGGAMTAWCKKTFAGTLAVNGTPNGAYPTASSADAATTLGRFSFDAETSGSAFTASGGYVLSGTLQVRGDVTVPIVDSDITISSGTVGFQGVEGGGATLVLGSSVGGRTLTVASGATAILDARFTGSVYTTASGTTLRENAVLAAGATLSARQSVSGGTAGTITIHGDVTGQGTAASESILDLQLANGSGAGQLTLGTPGASGSDLIVNGTTTGGLKVQGTNAILSGHLSAARLAAVTGTGGSLTIAPADATFTMPASSMWSDTDISLRVVDSYASGTDLALSDAAATWARPITIDSGAILEVGHATTATTISSVIAGAGAPTKTGAATTTLSATNTYSGTTTVSAGTLIVTGAQGSSAVAVAGGTLRGTGTVGAITGTSGTIQPGTSGSYTALSTSTANLSAVTTSVRIGGFTVGTNHDRLACSGALTLGGSGTLALDLTGLGTTGTATGIITCSGVPTGAFANVTVSNNTNNYNVSVTYASGTINVVVAASGAKSVYWHPQGSSSNPAVAANWTTDQAGTTRIATLYATDTLRFDGTGTNADNACTLPAALTCAAIVFTGYSGTFTDAGYTLTVNGSATFISGMTLTATGTLAMNSGGTLTGGGKTLFNVGSTGGTLVFADDFSIAGVLTKSAGTLNYNSRTITYSGAAKTHDLTGCLTTDYSGTAVFNGAGSTYLFGTGDSRPMVPSLTVNADTTVNCSVSRIAETTSTCILTLAAGKTLTLGANLRPFKLGNLAGATTVQGAGSIVAGLGFFWWSGYDGQSFPSTSTTFNCPVILETSNPLIAVTVPANHAFGNFLMVTPWLDGTIQFLGGFSTVADYAIDPAYSGGSTARTMNLAYTAASTVSVGGDVTYYPNGTYNHVVNFNSGSAAFGLNVTGSIPWTNTAGTLNVTTGAGTWNVGGYIDLTGADTFTATSGHVMEMTATSGGTYTLTSAGKQLYTLKLSPTNSISLSDAASVNDLVVNTINAITLSGASGLTLRSGNLTRNDVTGTEGAQVVSCPVALGANGTWTNSSTDSQLTASGVVSGAFSLTKQGSGTIVLSSANTYSGGTTVSAGTLLATNSSGSGTGTGAITVSGGTFGGSGTASGAVSVSSGATVAPGTGGATTATLATGALTFASGSTCQINFNGTTVTTGYDRLSVTGAVALGGSTLSLTLGAVPVNGTVYTIIANDGVDACSGTFAGIAQGGSTAATYTGTPYGFVVSYTGGDGNDVTLTSSSDADGANEVWAGAGADSNWNTGMNWRDGTVPGASDNISFPDVALQTVSMNVAATVGTITFNAADVYTVGGASTLTLGGTVTQSGAGTVALNVPVATGNAARTLSGAGSGQVTFTGVVSGTGLITVAGGSYRMLNSDNTFTDGTRSTGGTLTAQDTRGTLDIRSNEDGELGPGASRIDGGTMSWLSATFIRPAIGWDNKKRQVYFGNAGGTLSIGSPMYELINGEGDIFFETTASPLTPATIVYGSVADSTNGWYGSGNSLLYRNSNTGNGALRFELNNGALLLFNRLSTGETTFVGHSGGAYPSSSAAATTARISIEGPNGIFPNNCTWAATGAGYIFRGTAQVMLDNGTQTINADVTIPSGVVGFQGTKTDASYDCVFGTGIGTNTLSIANGATAIMDVRFLADVSSTTAGGLVVKHNVALAGGGTLSFRQTVAGGTVSRIGVAGDITATGDATNEAVVDIQLAGGSGAGQLDLGTPGGSGCDLIVNGATTGGMKVQGTAARLVGALTAARLAAVTGSGGYLSIAPSDATFTMPTSSQWSASGVGLRVVDSYASGTDLVLSDAAATWARPITIDSGAILEVGHATTATTISSVIAGAGALTKTGAATTTLSATNTYSGTTTVSAGTLIVTGAQGSSAVALAGGTLRGTGTVGAITGTSGTIQPGTSGSYTALSTSTANLSAVTTSVRIGGFTAGTNHDRLACSGALTLGGTAALTLDLAGLGATGTATGIVTCSNTPVAFGSVTISNNASNYNVSLQYASTSVNAVVSAGGATLYWHPQGASTDGNLATNWTTDQAGLVRAAAIYASDALSFNGAGTNRNNACTLTAGLSGASLDSTGYTGTFSDAGFTVTVGGNVTLVSGMTFTTTGTLTLGASATLTTGGKSLNHLTANTGTLTMGDAVTVTGVATLGAAVVNGGNLLTVNSSGGSTIGGLLSGSGGLTKSGSGSLTLSGANTFSGGTTLSAGTLTAGSTAALGAASAAVTLSGGTLVLATDTTVNAWTTTISGSAAIVSNRATVGAGVTQTLGTLSIGPFTLGATQGANVSSGTALVAFGATTLSGTATINPTTAGITLTTVGGANTHLVLDGGNANNVISGAITTGTGTLTKSGTSVWTLQGTSTYTGATTVSAGTLWVNGAISSSVGQFAVAASAILGGSGSIGGQVSSANTATISLGASTGAIGTFTFSAVSPLVPTATTTLAIDINGGSGDQVLCSAASGSLDLTKLALSISATSPTSDVTVISYPNGTFITPFASVSGLPAGYLVVYNTRTVVLQKIARYWVGTVMGNWSDTANWSTTSGTGSGAAVPVATNAVYFDGAGGTTGACTLDVTGSAQTLTMDSGYSGSFAFGTNTLSVGGNADLRSGGGFTGTSGGLAMSATGTLTPRATGTLPNLTITGGITTLATNDLNLAEALTISGGNLTANGRNATVAGNWTNSVGTGGFSAGTASVILNGAAASTQVLSGSTTFNNLTATCTTARTLNFAAGTTQTVGGALTLTGATGQRLSLRSTVNGSTWNLAYTGARTITAVAVQDGTNLGAGPLNPSGSTDLGNCVNWFAPLAVALSTPVHCPVGDDIASYGRTLNPFPALIWYVPAYRDGVKLHFVVAVDGSTVADSAVSQAGFDYYNGTTWTLAPAFPAVGVDQGAGTQLVRWHPQVALGVAAHTWTVLAVEAGGAHSSPAGATRRFLIASTAWTAGLVAGSPIRVGHVEELRLEVDYARNFRGLADMVWTDTPLFARQTLIRKVHVDELRTGLSAVTTISGASVTIGAATITARQTSIAASHLSELRTALEGQ